MAKHAKQSANSCTVNSNFFHFVMFTSYFYCILKGINKIQLSFCKHSANLTLKKTCRSLPIVEKPVPWQRNSAVKTDTALWVCVRVVENDYALSGLRLRTRRPETAHSRGRDCALAKQKTRTRKNEGLNTSRKHGTISIN